MKNADNKSRRKFIKQMARPPDASKATVNWDPVNMKVL